MSLTPLIYQKFHFETLSIDFFSFCSAFYTRIQGRMISKYQSYFVIVFIPRPSPLYFPFLLLHELYIPKICLLNIIHTLRHIFYHTNTHAYSNNTKHKTNNKHTVLLYMYIYPPASLHMYRSTYAGFPFITLILILTCIPPLLLHTLFTTIKLG